jgi:hypothetical protein
LGFKRGFESVGGVNAELLVTVCKVEGRINKGSREHIENYIGVWNRKFDITSVFV